MTNIDSRGVKRGRCGCENCEEFEWASLQVGSFCTYCGCVPIKHVKLENGQKSQLPKFDEVATENELLNPTPGPSNLNKSTLLSSKKDNSYQINIKTNNAFTAKFGKKANKAKRKEKEVNFIINIKTNIQNLQRVPIFLFRFFWLIILCFLSKKISSCQLAFFSLLLLKFKYYSEYTKFCKIVIQNIFYRL